MTSHYDYLAIITKEISHPAHFFFLKTMIKNSTPNDNLDSIKYSDEYRELYEIEQNELNNLIKEKRRIKYD